MESQLVEPKDELYDKRYLAGGAPELLLDVTVPHVKHDGEVCGLILRNVSRISEGVEL